MARAPFQVLVFPFRVTRENAYEYALFQRADASYWQGIAGGGEGDESAIEAARREAYEEAGIPLCAPFYELDFRGCVPVTAFSDRDTWDARLSVIPEYCFGVEFAGPIHISPEHSATMWLPYKECERRLHWDSNRVALRELDERLRAARLNGPLP
ncbi:MAG TPA: NUDIX domain-containing protein [Armatimonadota bacterium]|nr:NUDIX domain-containing protein [Armatimonadota bacterium]